MRFEDIPQFPQGHYQVDISWTYLEEWLCTWEDSMKCINQKLELNPNFQRGHIWNKEQKEKYIEYILQNGESGRIVYFNIANFSSSTLEAKATGNMVCIDGLQRLNAVKSFMNNEVKAFGLYYWEYEDRLHPARHRLTMIICAISTRLEILKWYLAFNSAGTQHSKEELERVQRLIDEETAYVIS